MNSVSLYHRLGGIETLEKVNEKFYQYLLSDPNLADFHIQHKSNIAKMHDGMVDYLSGLTGGANTYMGPELKEVHKKLNIKMDYFNTVWECLARAFK